MRIVAATCNPQEQALRDHSQIGARYASGQIEISPPALKPDASGFDPADACMGGLADSRRGGNGCKDDLMCAALALCTCRPPEEAHAIFHACTQVYFLAWKQD
jgi:hypothetical protein